jgi:quinohemoprotein ethanol dehydrogenase
MLVHKLTAILLPVAGLVGSAFYAAAQQSKRVDDVALKAASKGGGDEWLTYGLSPGETRYSTLNQINAGNVSRLGLAWAYDIGPGGGNQENTPLVWNGTLFGITNWSVVYALDVRTGKEKWRWDPEVNQAAVRPKLCCGVVNRGLALYNGMVIAPINDGRLQAINAETGKVVWEARVAYPQDNYTITMAPRIAKGKVVIGVSGAEYPVRGFFAAYDANTGAFAWKFYTVPGDPSKPFENSAMRKAAPTWDPEAYKLGGGGTVWDGLSYDPDTDTVYVGTGNGGPWPEELRKSKGKDNLYVASIIAVSGTTGEMKWYFQMVPGDSWDFDSVQQMILTDLNINGKTRKVIMQANKNGFFYVLDRVTGQFISAQPFAQVTWAKGIDQTTGRPIINPEADYNYKKELVSISPGPGGAHNWSPMSYNPTTGLVYIPTTTTSSFNYKVDENFEYKPGQNNMGLARGTFGPQAAGAPSTPPVKPPAIGPAPQEGQRGALIAWDPVTQKERWRANGGGSIGGGTVTTAGNLVFHVIPDGHMYAYSADKGEKLWEINTGLRGGMSPPITYMVDGKQYVSVAGGTGVVRFTPPGGAPPPPATAPAKGAAANANAADQGDGVHVGTAAPAAAPGGQGAAAGGGGGGAGGPGGFGGPAVTPKLLTFVLDGKTPMPVSEPVSP